MNILDENVLADQRELLQHWKIPFRQIGHEVGWSGMTDEEIIPLLLSLRRPTFFSLDADFFDRALLHARYGLVCLDVQQIGVGTFHPPRASSLVFQHTSKALWLGDARLAHWRGCLAPARSARGTVAWES